MCDGLSMTKADLIGERPQWKACVQETSGKHWGRDSHERPEQERSWIPRDISYLTQTKAESEGGRCLREKVLLMRATLNVTRANRRSAVPALHSVTFLRCSPDADWSSSSSCGAIYVSIPLAPDATSPRQTSIFRT